MDFDEFELDAAERMGRLTALWAVTEVSLGGLMHALRIPFSGLFVGSTALLCLFLMTRHTRRPADLVRALAVVALVKALGSPQASPFAYVAMAVQTLCCLPLTGRLGRSKAAVALFLGLAAMYSPFQRLLVIWITLGSEGTEAVLQWAHGVAGSLGLPDTSLWIALAVYFGLYLAASCVVVALAWRWMSGLPDDEQLKKAWASRVKERAAETGAMEPRPWLKGGATLTLLASGAVLAWASLSDSSWATLFWRPTLVVVAWVALVRPALVWWLQRQARRHRRRHEGLLQSIWNLFPALRRLVAFSWHWSGAVAWWRRPAHFLTAVFTVLMFSRLGHG